MKPANEIMDPLHAHRDLHNQKRLSLIEATQDPDTPLAAMPEIDMELAEEQGWIDGFTYCYLKLAPIVVKLHQYHAQLTEGAKTGVFDEVMLRCIQQLGAIGYTRIDPSILNEDGTGFNEEYLAKVKEANVQSDILPASE